MIRFTMDMMMGMKLNKSLFIALEGGDGTGKSTVCKALCERLIISGRQAISTREPGGTPLGLKLRHLLLNEGHLYSQDVQLLMLNAARLAHWQQVILPALLNGVYVVCDRFIDSTRVYQALVQPSPEHALARVNTLHDQFLADAQPDAVLVLDMDPVECLKRLQRRGGEVNYLDAQPLQFHTEVRNGFRRLAERGHPYHLITADNPVEQVVSDCWTALSEYLC